jgi:hypothetical protein
MEARLGPMTGADAFRRLRTQETALSLWLSNSQLSRRKAIEQPISAVVARNKGAEH